MILKKLKDNHYVILAYEKTLSNNGDWYLSHPNYNKTVQWNMPLNTQHEGKQVWINKITYSTQPLEQYYGAADGTIPFVYHKIKQLSISEVEELINGYSVEKMAEREYREYPTNPINKPEWKFNKDINYHRKRKAYIKGFNAHKNLVKDKLFTIDDIKKAFEHGIVFCQESISLSKEAKNTELDLFIQSLLPPTIWNVEFDENNKLKLTQNDNNRRNDK